MYSRQEVILFYVQFVTTNLNLRNNKYHKVLSINRSDERLVNKIDVENWAVGS